MNANDRLLQRLPPLQVRRLDTLLIACIALLAVAALWAALAYIEEQIRAPGTVIASSRSQVVQAVDGGTLKALHVKEGDPVKAGDLIAELDPVRFQASSEEIAAKVAALQASLVRGEAELSGRPLNFGPDLARFPDIVQAQSALHRKRLQAQQEELQALEQSAVLAQEELDALSKLAEAGDAGKSEVLRARRQLNDLRAQATNKRNAFRQEAQMELAKARTELAQTEQVFTQRSEALQSTYLRAPMAGIVKNVRMTTRGAVLKAGDELLQIVPSDDPLVVEAKVAPADVAFLRPGLRANVKLDAWDYTLYGALDGRVVYISPDTLEENLQRDEKPYYRVHIQTDGNTPEGRKPLDVRPGMTATVEIITGERSVASYVLKPLRRTADEALHEP
jgi:adhesin transport system membrane fusion protein